MVTLITEDNSVKGEYKAHGRDSTNTDTLSPLGEFKSNYTMIQIHFQAKRLSLQCDFHTNESGEGTKTMIDNLKPNVTHLPSSCSDCLSILTQASGTSLGMALPTTPSITFYPLTSLLPLPHFR